MFLCLSIGNSFGQAPDKKWNEIIGKKVVNHQGVTLGYVRGTAIDLEHGRYFGLIVSSGGIFGSGKTQIVPPGAMTENSTLKTLFLDMDEAKFRNAPTCELSEDRGPPNITQCVAVYRYFGQQPYFASQVTAAKDQKLVQLGFIMKGSQIIGLPVENLQGKFLGNVKALTDLDSRTGRFTGVVIDTKIVPPEALRYNFDHTRLRINNHDEAFRNTATFNFTEGGNFATTGSAMRPGIPLPPLQQGNSTRDKAITAQIITHISGDGNLSHYAKNIQVGTVQGVATLRGRVQNQQEKNRIGTYSLQAAGPGRVINQLDVRPINARDKAVDADLK